MAGSIIISKELRFPLSSQQFDYLVERIRLGFDSDGQVFLKKIYSPMDDGGMDFISVKNEGKAGLKSFFYAVLKASQTTSAENSYAPFCQLWNHLLTKIRLDPRYNFEWEPPKGAS